MNLCKVPVDSYGFRTFEPEYAESTAVGPVTILYDVKNRSFKVRLDPYNISMPENGGFTYSELCGAVESSVFWLNLINDTILASYIRKAFSNFRISHPDSIPTYRKQRKKKSMTKR